MPDVFCGIDLGTQGARCVFVRADGTLVAEADRALEPVDRDLPEGWFEQEPGGWVEAVTDAVREAAAGLETSEPLRHRVAAVGVTSTSGTLVVLDKEHVPLVPAIMYSDSRGRRQAEAVQDAAADLSEKLGYRFSSSFGLPKILWLKRERPEVYEQAALFLSPTDFLIGWLTGRWQRSDQTNMLKFGYDVLEDRWPDFIEAELGIGTDLLPHVQKSGEKAGELTRQTAARLGLPEGVPVVAGMTDGCASQLSSGAAEPGEYNTTLGTTMVVKGVSERLLLDPLGRIYCHRHPAGWWLPGGASNTGCECLAAEFGPEETLRRSRSALDHSPTGVIAYPLVGTGERFPFLDADAESFMVGEPADRDELFAAYLEGIACLERLAYETLEDLGAEVGDRVYSAGGGSASDAWLQVRADTLGKTMARPQLAGAAMGAALLAASHTYYSDLPEAAGAMVNIDAEVAPRPDYVAAYDEKYVRFREQCMRRGYLQRPWPGEA